MIETLGNLVRSIVILIFLTVLLEMLLPQGIFRRYLRVLAGILLILTILTPLQKIMHMAPLWDEADVFSETEIKNENLQQILAKGEALQEENIRFALQDYRSNIFTLLENELAERFGKKLLCFISFFSGIFLPPITWKNSIYQVKSVV
jgi:stage III sporulation protein AF